MRDMYRYYCPDHPDQLLHDDNPRADAHRPELRSPRKLVTCPLDNRTYSLAQCRKEKSH